MKYRESKREEELAMTEAEIIVENFMLREELKIVRAQRDGCLLILEKNLKDLVRENWRPHPDEEIT